MLTGSEYGEPLTDFHFLSKKALLRECKRHTACCITDTHSVALVSWRGVPPCTPDGGGTPQVPMGVPNSVPTEVPHPVLIGGTSSSPNTDIPHPVPTGGGGVTPILTCPMYDPQPGLDEVLPGQDWMGVPPAPWEGTWDQALGYPLERT